MALSQSRHYIPNMLSRRYRLVVSILLAAGLFMLVMRQYDYDSEQITMPDMRIPDGWLHKDDHGAIAHDLPESESESEGPPDHGQPLAGAGGDDEQEDQPTSTTASPPPSWLEDSLARKPPEQTAITGPEKIYTSDSLVVGSKGSVQSSKAAGGKDVDWSRFAYTQYVTNNDYLCNSVMIFEALHRLGAKADLVMMYPSQMMSDPAETSPQSASARLIIKARDEYQAKLVPIHIQHRDAGESKLCTRHVKRNGLHPPIGD